MTLERILTTCFYRKRPYFRSNCGHNTFTCLLTFFLQWFVSYPRGEVTTPFARWLRTKLEEADFSVWMDEVSIKAGSDWRLQIGTAIRQSSSLVAVIDEKFNKSMHCKNEVNMMSDQGKPIFPIIFRDFSLQNLALDLQ